MLRTLHLIPGQSETTTVSLATLSTNALQLFADLAIIAPGDSDAEGIPEGLSIEQQQERLQLWASNLGATHLGHSSLDYRLRQADLVRDAIAAFLNDLCGSLLECREFLLYGDLSGMDGVDASAETGQIHNYPYEDVAAAQAIMLEADYGSENRSLGEQDFSLILESIAETINCLYKVATRIRNPATRTLTKKVLDFAILDRETGVDLTEDYALLDREHLREVFRDYRSAHGQRPPKEQGISPQDLDLARGEPLEFLAQRLAQANTIRRKQFAYWSRHRMKLDKALEATARVVRVQQPQQQQQASRSISTIARSAYVADSVVPSLPTTATTLDPAQIDLEDAKSVATVSDYAESIRSISTTRREAAEIPEPPSKLKGQRYFECPYCLTLCSGAYLGRKTWRTHLLRDLRPYVCTYRDCSEATCLFDTRQEWVAHEDSCHRRIWRCLEHREATFPTVAAYKHHIRDMHESNGTELESTELLRIGESAPEVADRPCPICLADIPEAKDLQQHIAAHLIRIALFSLPRSTDADVDTDSGTSWSERANGHHSDSSQITSGESLNSSAQAKEEGMRSPENKNSGQSTGLSQNALRDLEALTSDQGSNAKVEQFLSDLNEPEPEDQPSENSRLLNIPHSTLTLPEDQESWQSLAVDLRLVADEASPTSHDIARLARDSAEDIDTGRDGEDSMLATGEDSMFITGEDSMLITGEDSMLATGEDSMLATMGKSSDGLDLLHAKAYVSSPKRLSNIEPPPGAQQQGIQDAHIPRQDSNQPRLPALGTPGETDEDFHCQECGEALNEGKAFELGKDLSLQETHESGTDEYTAGRRWHLDCFKCSNCRSLLDSDHNLLLVSDGGLLCDNCTYHCTVCGNKIEDLAIIAADGKQYCAACFRCRNCKRKIENLKYANTSQGIFCMDCHEGLMARRREKARDGRRQREQKQDNDINQSPAALDQQNTAADDRKDTSDSVRPRPSSTSRTASDQQLPPPSSIAGPSTVPDEQEPIESRGPKVVQPSGQPSLQQGHRGRTVLSIGRNESKLIEGYDQEQGPTRQSGRSGAVKKVQDFFRRRRPPTDGDHR
ncbi:uncharacterized protein Z520_03017 [Fonsecaea multimorphosa CBS 102226]|uniref:LIM zinc-binding domain-containing protein n=1 Tax=Fonsecaea multimorphosa CBS 102226 TaxID=1442371 RepID=A0A0D2KDV9_9EURO|nr:uncharacterized protein Z520_03017 [Fonsecaea multimorphosa CBS 102226]KIY01465.1 hypothetical protein Z520_03017 [Fonsecaea multimorphosa CBS 102226]